MQSKPAKGGTDVVGGVLGALLIYWSAITVLAITGRLYSGVNSGHLTLLGVEHGTGDLLLALGGALLAGLVRAGFKGNLETSSRDSLPCVAAYLGVNLLAFPTGTLLALAGLVALLDPETLAHPEKQPDPERQPDPEKQTRPGDR